MAATDGLLALIPFTALMKGAEETMFPLEGLEPPPPTEEFETTIRWSEGIGEVGLELLIRRGASVGEVSFWCLGATESTIPFCLEEGGSKQGPLWF